MVSPLPHISNGLLTSPCTLIVSPPPHLYYGLPLSHRIPIPVHFSISSAKKPQLLRIRQVLFDFFHQLLVRQLSGAAALTNHSSLLFMSDYILFKIMNPFISSCCWLLYLLIKTESTQEHNNYYAIILHCMS